MNNPTYIVALAETLVRAEVLSGLVASHLRGRDLLWEDQRVKRAGRRPAHVVLA